LNEIKFTHLLEGGQARDFLVAQAHLPRPATAGGATLAFVENRHARIVTPSVGPAKRHDSADATSVLIKVQSLNPNGKPEHIVDCAL
jgi:hypothetical protein